MPKIGVHPALPVPDLDVAPVSAPVWRRAKVKIKTYDSNKESEVEVQADVLGVIAVHFPHDRYKDSKACNVSHLPTGLRICAAQSRADAKLVAETVVKHMTAAQLNQTEENKAARAFPGSLIRWMRSCAHYSPVDCPYQPEGSGK